MRNPRRIHPVLFVTMVVTMFALMLASLSQVMFARVNTNAHPEVRVTAKVDDARRTVLPGHVSSALRTAIDMGRQDPRTPSPGMIMVLKSSEEQNKEIRKLIDEQQDKRTANYHQWVTPEEFGEHFGVDDADLAQVKSWLTKQGFSVDEVSKSKRVIRFSGNIGQVEKAFGTEMHLVTYRGQMHVANTRDISVPEALNRVIAGVTLHNFYRTSSIERDSRIKLGKKVRLGPHYTSSSATHYVGPTDFAAIYNTAPLLAAGINGTGQSIAVVGRSDIQMSDVQSYRQLFNLPVNDPTFINAGQDNGTEPGDDGESDLDVEISGGMAPNAKVYFVVGTPTFLVDGITNSVQYIVENNLADIISISYGSCEAVEGAGGNAFNNQAFEQASAQGMSVFIASGDNGPVGCDNQNDSVAVLGYAAGAEGSTPYSIAVGGTELVGECPTFGTGCSPTNFAKYWAATNNNYYLSSALAYIPEVPWNEGKGSNSSADASTGLSGLWSSSGAVSAYYLRPSWQQGANSAILTSPTDPALATYLAGAGGSITVQGGNWVSSVTLTNPGSGYTGATTTVTFSGGTCTTLPNTGATANISGGSVAATGGLAQINFNGTSVTIPVQGLNCTVAPNVTFGATSGTVATGTVNLGPMTQTPPLIAGVPHRLTPDFSLNAADGHDATLFCSEGVCEFTTVNGQNTIQDAGLVGGTSVAAPSMAGIQALINQANGGRQGMPGYVYYGLAAAQNNTICNSSALVPPNTSASTSCAFQDIQAGNTYICGTSTCTSSSGTKLGWPAAVGYDLATGLGSINAYNMATEWHNVVFNSTTTTLNLSQTTFAHGTPVTLSGTVSGSGTPTGDVAFIVSQGAIGVPVNLNTGAFAGPGAFTTLSGGNFSDILANLPAGVYNVQARYGGDGTFASSLSAPVQVTVSGGETTSITVSPQFIDQTACNITIPQNTFSYGQFVWVAAAVTGSSGQGVPTGTVTISVDGNPYATETLDPQGMGYLAAGNIPTTSCIYDYMFAQSPTLSGGVHSITATYSGDGTFAAGSSATPASVTITPLAITPTLAVGATNITSGFADPLTATFAIPAISSSSGKQSSGPTGTVTFFNGATNLGSASVVPTISFSNNVYTYAATATTTSSLITASGSITAVYSGDSNYTGTTSTGVAVTVGTDAATTTAVTSNANPTTLSGRPTFTATVTNATSGAVTFYDGSAFLGAGSAVGTAHTSTFRPAAATAFFGGTHNITATYAGVSGSFAASTSPVLVETVTKGTNTINLACKQVGTSGQAYTCAAVLTPSQTNATFAPNQGVATFFDGATPIGTGVPQITTSGQGGYGLWTATMSTTSLAVGTHTITATYNDINYGPGNTSNAVTVYVGNTNVGVYTPVSGTTLTGSSATFHWFPIPGANFWLDIGSTPGGNNYLQSGNIGNVLTKSVTGLPVDGSTIYVTLWALVNGNWSSTMTTYTAFGGGSNKATMATPPGGSTLTSGTVTFTWNAATPTPAGYWLDIGNTAGGNQYYQSGALSNATLSKTVTTLPTDGSMIFVTLYTNIGTVGSPVWLSNAYTYTAFTGGSCLGTMASPLPGALSGNTVTFNWTANCGGESYWLDVGSLSSENMYYQSGNLGGATTTTVTTLPADGSQINVTLWTLVGGNWLNNVYTYTSNP